MRENFAAQENRSVIVTGSNIKITQLVKDLLVCFILFNQDMTLILFLNLLIAGKLLSVLQHLSGIFSLKCLFIW